MIESAGTMWRPACFCVWDVVPFFGEVVRGRSNAFAGEYGVYGEEQYLEVDGHRDVIDIQ